MSAQNPNEKLGQILTELENQFKILWKLSANLVKTQIQNSHRAITHVEMIPIILLLAHLFHIISR